MPVISPTTLLVAGSISDTLSPALLVWMMRTLCCAESDAANSTATTMAHRAIVRLVIIDSSKPAGLQARPALTHGPAGLKSKTRPTLSFPHYPCTHGLPLGIVLRGPVLAAAVVEVAAGRFVERVNQERTLRVTGKRRTLRHDL